jgi:23S rRNA pseudouridine1911/1915/1917 synthase
MPGLSILVTIADGPSDRLDRALAAHAPPDASLSRSRLARLIAEGAVTRGGVPVTDVKAKAAAGETYAIAVPAAEDSPIGAEAIPLVVIHEDDDLIVIDKPAGMVVHPAPGSRSGTLVNALIAHCGDTLSGVGGERRPGIVHRIDKDTSGLLVAAKTDRAHHALARQFEKHTAERAYLAVCHGVPDPADPRLRGVPGVAWEAGATLRIATRLARHPTDRQRQAVVKGEGGRPAVTRARVVEGFGTHAALLECRLETGRTHQIRVHMAHAGHGLVGDPVYGGKRRLPGSAPGAADAAAFPRQALHAAMLGFVHPVTGAALRFEAPLPPDMAALLAALRGETL